MMKYCFRLIKTQMIMMSSASVWCWRNICTRANKSETFGDVHFKMLRIKWMRKNQRNIPAEWWNEIRVEFVTVCFVVFHFSRIIIASFDESFYNRLKCALQRFNNLIFLFVCYTSTEQILVFSSYLKLILMSLVVVQW